MKSSNENLDTAQITSLAISVFTKETDVKKLISEV